MFHMNQIKMSILSLVKIIIHFLRRFNKYNVIKQTILKPAVELDEGVNLLSTEYQNERVF